MVPARAIVGGALLLFTENARAESLHPAVSGVAVERVSVGGAEVAWADLASPKTPGLYSIRFAASGDAVMVPHCNGRERVLVDGAVKDRGSKGPLVIGLSPGAHDIVVEVRASTYEKRIACGEPPRVGAPIQSSDGVTTLHFASPDKARGGGGAVVVIPGGHDRTRPSPVLVGTHPWNGSPWTYAAYRELIAEAGQRGVVLLMPSGLGNSLYVADAEDEVLRAIDALSGEIAVDRQRVSIWGASMGGAGATTISFHQPDRFAFVASFFGDSRYDLTGYVRSIFSGKDGAHRVNALDIVENGRHLPVLLVHGDEDRSSPIKQSIMLFDAMKKAGFDVTFAREPKMGHEGPLVVKYIREVVKRAASAVAPSHPARVSFRTVRQFDTRAYGVRLFRRNDDADAFIDVEGRPDGIHVLAAENLTAIGVAGDALGVKRGAPVHVSPRAKIAVRWEP